MKYSIVNKGSLLAKAYFYYAFLCESAKATFLLIKIMKNDLPNPPENGKSLYLDKLRYNNPLQNFI